MGRDAPVNDVVVEVRRAVRAWVRQIDNLDSRERQRARVCVRESARVCAGDSAGEKM